MKYTKLLLTVLMAIFSLTVCSNCPFGYGPAYAAPDDGSENAVTRMTSNHFPGLEPAAGDDAIRVIVRMHDEQGKQTVLPARKSKARQTVLRSRKSRAKGSASFRKLKRHVSEKRDRILSRVNLQRAGNKDRVRSARTLYSGEKGAIIACCHSTHDELYIVEYTLFIKCFWWHGKSRSTRCKPTNVYFYTYPEQTPCRPSLSLRPRHNANETCRDRIGKFGGNLFE